MGLEELLYKHEYKLVKPEFFKNFERDLYLGIPSNAGLNENNENNVKYLILENPVLEIHKAIRAVASDVQVLPNQAVVSQGFSFEGENVQHIVLKNAQLFKKPCKACSEEVLNIYAHGREVVIIASNVYNAEIETLFPRDFSTLLIRHGAVIHNGREFYANQLLFVDFEELAISKENVLNQQLKLSQYMSKYILQAGRIEYVNNYNWLARNAVLTGFHKQDTAFIAEGEEIILNNEHLKVVKGSVLQEGSKFSGLELEFTITGKGLMFKKLEQMYFKKKQIAF
ncbi:hypothetical protein J7L02_02910 [Candidatus Woesearchaeota archaeon]|nr:hypothetical protein [Candidatus Woesearchaeota archaeon]